MNGRVYKGCSIKFLFSLSKARILYSRRDGELISYVTAFWFGLGIFKAHEET